MRTQLLCTFAHKTNLDIVIEYIKQNFKVPEQRIFVFSNYAKRNELYCTFNAEDNGHRGKNTISIHRKKETNTLYTINALNELIKSLNGGVVNTKFPINWKHYRNCILLTQHNELKQLNTKIHKIIEL